MAQLSRPFILGVTGVSASGKSTVASGIAEALGGCQLISGDDFFLFDQYLTDTCPTTTGQSGVTWKDWETPVAVDFQAMRTAIQQALTRSTEAGQKFVVVEGFQLLSSETAALFDGVVSVDIPREVSWARRLARARAMSHFPPGFSTAEDPDRNYEVLDSYTLSYVDRSALKAAVESASIARKNKPKNVAGSAEEGDNVTRSEDEDDGDLSWLHLYFDEVIWPAAEAQMASVARFEELAADSSSTSERPLFFLRLDGLEPSDKETWVRSSISSACEFALSAHAKLAVS